MTDATLRKRIQNRVAQRKHREYIQRPTQPPRSCATFHLTRQGRKTQEEAAHEGNTNAQNTTSTASNHLWGTSVNEAHRGPLLNAEDISSATKERFDDGLDVTTLADPANEAFAMAGFAHQTWPMDLHGDIVADGAADVMHDVERRTTAPVFHPDRRGAASHSFNQALHAAPAAAAPVGFGQPQTRDTMSHHLKRNVQQQQKNKTQQHTNSGAGPSDIANMPGQLRPGHQQRRNSTTAVNSIIDHLESCAECSTHIRQSQQHTSPRSLDNTYIHRYPTSEFSSPPPSTPIQSNRTSSSASGSFSRTKLLRGHGIDLNHILSHVDSERRASASSHLPHIPGSDSTISDNSDASHMFQYPDDWGDQVNHNIASDNNEPTYIERLGPGMTKVVMVLYIGERNRRS